MVAQSCLPIFASKNLTICVRALKSDYYIYSRSTIHRSCSPLHAPNVRTSFAPHSHTIRTFAQIHTTGASLFALIRTRSRARSHTFGIANVR